MVTKGTAESGGVRDNAPSWPVARTYTGGDLARISLPVGGIGTGTVGFGGRGQFRDWELENHPSKGLTSALTFFACRVAGSGVPAQARIMEGALLDEEVEGWQGSPAPLAGMPRFAECEFQASYPFGRVVLTDPHFPVDVSITAFNPLLPGNPEDSGLPLAAFRVTLTSRADTPVTADVMFSVETMVGHSLRAASEPSRPQIDARSGPRSGRVSHLRRGDGRPARGMGDSLCRRRRQRLMGRANLGHGKVESGTVRDVAGIRRDGSA